MQRADMVIGMHGAALTYSVLLPPHAALVELWPQARAGGRGGGLSVGAAASLLACRGRGNAIALLAACNAPQPALIWVCPSSPVPPSCAQATGIWRCYENMAQWGGALYRRVANTNPSRHRDGPRGDVTDIELPALARVVAELAPLVRQRRAAAGAAG